MIQLGTIEDIAEIITIINEVKKEMEEIYMYIKITILWKVLL